MRRQETRERPFHVDVNDNGEIVIRQPASLVGDSIVTIAAEQIDDLCEWVRMLRLHAVAKRRTAIQASTEPRGLRLVRS